MGTQELRGVVGDAAMVCLKRGRGAGRSGAGWLLRGSEFPEAGIESYPEAKVATRKEKTVRSIWYWCVWGFH